MTRSQISPCHDALAVHEEIFGPVEVVFTWNDYDEMIGRANGVDYGRPVGVDTDDIDRAYRTADDLDVGSVWVNTYDIFLSGQPFGGTNESGIGREIGAETLKDTHKVKR